MASSDTAFPSHLLRLPAKLFQQLVAADTLFREHRYYDATDIYKKINAPFAEWGKVAFASGGGALVTALAIAVVSRSGTCLSESGQFAAAEGIFDSAARIPDHPQSGSHPVVLSERACIALAIGNHYHLMGCTTEAILSFTRALDIYEGLMHTEGMAHASLSLATQYLITGCFDLSASFITKATSPTSSTTHLREIDVRLHSVTAALHFERGSLVQSPTELSHAVGFAELALDAALCLHSADSFEVAALHTQLARCYVATSQPEKARESLDAALIAYRSLDKEGQSADWGMHRYVTGILCHARLKYSSAMRSFNAAHVCWTRHLPPHHPLIGDVLAEMADCLEAIGGSANIEEAAVKRRQAHDITRRSQTRCSGRGCPRRLREDGGPLDQCAGCLCTYYCNEACQTADWKAEHKAECRALRQEGSFRGDPALQAGASAAGE